MVQGLLLAGAVSVSALAAGPVFAQAIIAPTKTSTQPTPVPAAAPALTPTPAPMPAALVAKPSCANPNALGVSRTVEIDTTDGPGFGFEHFKMHDFLQDKEVVLTFDDGPWPVNTPAVLKALADECVKATFFPIGKHATYHPEILKHVAEQGHTIGAHTWSHANLNRFKNEQNAKDEIEKGFAAVKWALGAPPAPFFRFPALQHPPAIVSYLGARNIAIFSTDLDSFDFKTRKADQVVDNVMKKLHKFNKGIILMHDFQPHTAEALPALLKHLKDGGFKVVHMKPAKNVEVIAKYEEDLVKEAKLPTLSTRPTSSVVRTISQ
jgi:peptidoglycan/xylan/chitin deacetylase (PgdA/CDA1 family)